MGEHLGDEIQCKKMLFNEHDPNSQPSYSELQPK